MPAIQK